MAQVRELTSYLEVVQRIEAALGEGPAWDDQRGRLIWVDIPARTIHELDPMTGTASATVLDRSVGAAVPHRDKTWAVAVAGAFGIVDRGSGEFESLAAVDKSRPNNRMNDAKCDPAGRFFGGTIAMDLAPGAGTLYRLGTDRRVEPVVEGLHVSNGLAWSPDASTFYLIDSFAGIDAFDYDIASGTLSGRRPLITFSATDGLPDGMTVDDEGFLWVAMFNGGCVRRFASDGTPDAVLRMPVTQPTSVVFGGADLTDLYITTARQDEHGPMSAERLAHQPLAGSVFRCRPGLRGTPTTPYRG